MDRPAGNESVVALSLILLTALAARLYRLTTLFPLMVDEAIYLRWAEIIRHQDQWFIALLDGKQPLCSWLYTPIVLSDAFDPIDAARVISVAAGVAATLFVYLIAARLGGKTAGLIAAALYAVAPYAVFYGHLAYNEALLDFFSTAAVFSILLAYVSPRASAWRAASAGLWLGAGFLCKTTFLPFFVFPAAICLLSQARRWRFLFVTYGVAAIAPAVLYVSVPNAPVPPSSSFFIHQLNYFIDRRMMLSAPFMMARQNLLLAVEYLNVYVTPLAVLAAIVACVHLAKRGRPIPALMVPFTAAVIVAESLVLTYYPSRYQFAYLWPLLVAIGCSLALFAESRRRLAGAFAAILIVAAGLRAGAILWKPGRFLHPLDIAHFVDGNPYSGYGVREAARAIEDVARHERRLIVLTDLAWGLPTDAIFVYLNERHGIEVHEAWWLDISPTFPLLPAQTTALMKSQYERVYGGNIEFSRAGAVVYVTDSLYHSAVEVRKRQPSARKIASFMKPGGKESIDVYRLQ